MRLARINPSPRVVSPAFEVSVRKVATSADLEVDEFSEDSRLMVVLDLVALEDGTLDLGAARLRIGTEPPVEPLASGRDDAPRHLEDGEFLPPLVLHARQRARVWLAFGKVPERAEFAQVQPVELDLPNLPGVQLSASNAGPRWESELPWRSIGNGYAELTVRRDGGHLGIGLLDLRWAFGRFILASAWGPGVGTQPDLTVRADITMSTRFMYVLHVSDQVVVSSGIGLESAIWPGKPRRDRQDYVFSPTLGVELGFKRIHSRSGPFPLHTSSVLARHNIFIGVLHAFGDDRRLPDFGLGIGYTNSMGY